MRKKEYYTQRHKAIARNVNINNDRYVHGQYPKCYNGSVQGKQRIQGTRRAQYVNFKPGYTLH
jgi:hypothetical protein